MNVEKIIKKIVKIKKRKTTNRMKFNENEGKRCKNLTKD